MADIHDRPVILNFTAELVEGGDYGWDSWGGPQDVLVIKVNGHEIARGEPGAYLDPERPDEAIADLLKSLLERE